MTNEQMIFVARFAIPVAFGLVASVIDLRVRKIPNWLCIGLFTTGLVFRVATAGWGGLGDAAGGFAVGFALLFFMWMTGGAGGGDVKFMAAAGVWLGAYHLVFVFVLSAILLGLFALVLVIWRLLTGSATKSSTTITQKDGKEVKVVRGIPYALPATLAIGLRLAWLMLINKWS